MNNSNSINIILFFITSIMWGLTIHYIWKVFQKNKTVLNSEKFTRAKKIRMMYNLIIRTGNIRIMTFVVTMLGFASSLSLVALGNIFYNGKTPEHFWAFILSILTFIFGLVGYIQYFRSEIPWKLYIQKGSLARFLGLIVLIFFWGISVISLIYMTMVWFK